MDVISLRATGMTQIPKSFSEFEKRVWRRIHAWLYYDKHKDKLIKRRLEKYHRTKKSKGIKDRKDFWVDKRKELLGINLNGIM